MADEVTNREQRLVNFLGWFSLGLGAAELFAPRAVAKLSGVNDGKTVTRIFGARELAAGVGILTQPNRAGWLWARVVGDAMDLAALGRAMRSDENNRGRLAIATAAVAGITALDIYCSQKLSRSTEPPITLRVARSVTIDRSAEDLYQAWRDIETLPTYMPHIESVVRTGENRWHWTAKGPGGVTPEWDAEIVADRANELIAWRSLEGSDIEHSGRVRFGRATGGRGTVVQLELSFQAPGGALGATIAKWFTTAPEIQISTTLHQFKQFMETGEIARTEGQPAGRERSVSVKYDELVRG